MHFCGVHPSQSAGSAAHARRPKGSDETSGSGPGTARPSNDAVQGWNSIHVLFPQGAVHSRTHETPAAIVGVRQLPGRGFAAYSYTRVAEPTGETSGAKAARSSSPSSAVRRNTCPPRNSASGSRSAFSASVAATKHQSTTASPFHAKCHRACDAHLASDQAAVVAAVMAAWPAVTRGHGSPTPCTGS